MVDRSSVAVNARVLTNATAVTVNRGYGVRKWSEIQ